MKIVRQTTQVSVRPTSGGGFLMCPKLTWLGGSFSDTLNPGFYLAQVTGSDNWERQRPVLGISESQLGFTVLLFGL